jgi:crossover junction endodeoxyribonuclease RuvC
MIILGVDPGTIITGYGIIEHIKNEVSIIASGTIIPQKTKSLAPRLKEIYTELNRLIIKYEPDEFAIETAFYNKNVQSTLKIGYARGVSLLAASMNDLKPSEYSPREVKKSIVGKGSASKEQVQYMIKTILNLNEKRLVLDESDALAVAVCHAFKIKSASVKSSNWKNFIEENPDRIINN